MMTLVVMISMEKSVQTALIAKMKSNNLLSHHIASTFSAIYSMLQITLLEKSSQRICIVASSLLLL